MATTVVLDVLTLTVRVPAGLPDAAAAAARRILGRAAFRGRLRRAVGAAARRFPGLRAARVVISR